MSALENAKTYTGKNLETIFFRPMLSGPSAIDLGVRVLYNMPVPTTVQMWEPKTDILQFARENPDLHGLIVRSEKVTAEIIDAAPALNGGVGAGGHDGVHALDPLTS